MITPSPRPLGAAYAYEPALQREANAAGHTYWYAYVRELCDRLGLTAAAIRPADLRAEALAGLSTLFLGDFPTGALDAVAGVALADWVGAGGTVIGFATEGLDDLFGLRYRCTIPQPGDPFTISATFSLAEDHPVSAGIHSPLHPQQRLLIVAPVRAVEAMDGVQTLGHLYNIYGGPLAWAAVTRRQVGLGAAYYVAFNLPQTMWAIQQGRPITGDYDGDGYYRTSDARVIGTNEPEVAYTDELLFLVQNMVARHPLPLVHQLPPHEGGVPDTLLFWGGDDEAAGGTQVPASDWMRAQGLPYHINIMPHDGAFAVSRAEFAAIRANGHECALHFNFIDGFDHPNAFSEADLRAQVELYERAYGERPICTVNHWLCWTGWAEPARWMAAAGIRADNSRAHRGSPPINPANMLGFSFGTAYPFYFYDDAAHGNQRINLLCQPITAYETGYTPQDTDYTVLHRALDLAARYHLTLNMFYHPVLVHNHATCRAAIGEALRYLAERGIAALHMGNDALWSWWSARSETRIEGITLHDGTLRCQVTCAYPNGCVVKVPLGQQAGTPVATCDGQTQLCVTREEFGQTWAYIVVPPGGQHVQLDRWAKPA